MFYVKAPIGDAEIRIEITDENTFTTCPECGAEHQVSLDCAIEDGQLDLYGTSVYCTDCSEKRQARLQNSTEGKFEACESTPPTKDNYRKMPLWVPLCISISSIIISLAAITRRLLLG